MSNEKFYPEKNSAIPDHLRCRVVFQDNSEHIYKIPTVKIQTYSLKEELSDGYLTEREYRNYVRLFHFAADRVLARHQYMREEVNQMTEPLIKLPSVIEDELRAEIQHLKKLVNQLSSDRTP